MKEFKKAELFATLVNGSIITTSEGENPASGTTTNYDQTNNATETGWDNNG